MTDINQTKLATLLNDTGSIVKEHRKNIREKGEDFNIFSVLKMEEDETKTHSGMIVALLDPNGNHYHGQRFLELFLKEIGYEYEDENLILVKVKAEHNLGKIPEDYLSGGSIDILINFPSGKAIAIENKIKAGDQKNQMYRYSLYKGADSRLYYLNLYGEKPTKKSLYKLSDKDYDIITYKTHVLNWLENCLLIVKPGSIVENAIKQYRILIKNLTHTMDNNLEVKLNKLIENNLKEAKYIHSHFRKAVSNIREKLRIAVCEEINNRKLDVTARPGNDTSHVYSQIWLNSEKLHVKDLQFGLESFSGKGHNHGRIFIGVFDREKEKEYEILSDGDYRLNSSWPLIRDIKTPCDNHLNLSSIKTLEKLLDDADYFNEMVDEVVNQVKDFVELYH
ncbi:hypothetical protein CW751_08035 [Brumimicrobium salinarum]|uniref:PD-(D/E)XK nuclease superfamily protein n=1 Tax=Brumimicrobium salinarum TaxID=2058658 RepID=A0A2I0R2T8_9FLAO|nr:PD-(D/E)XK nuclease family protein [Brumimicrobium salinarum]PKR80710.1 hypothetical protein CW751_08035 [Brumimicrobium salinarum]